MCREHCPRVVPESDQISHSGRAHVWDTVLHDITICPTFNQFLRVLTSKAPVGSWAQLSGTLPEGCTRVRSYFPFGSGPCLGHCIACYNNLPNIQSILEGFDCKSTPGVGHSCRKHCSRVVPESDQISHSGRAHLWDTVLHVIMICPTFNQFLRVLTAEARRELGTAVGNTARGLSPSPIIFPNRVRPMFGPLYCLL